MKRSVLGWVLLGLGAFLLVTALLGKFWAPGVVEKTPKKVDEVIYLTGSAKKLDLQTGKQQNVPIKVSSFFKTDTERSTDEVDVWANDNCVVVDIGSPADCVTAKDPRLVQAWTDIFATSRTTAEAVNDPKYFVGVTSDTRAEGLVNKFPFHVEKKTYTFWDTTANISAPAEYIGSDSLDGLDTYKFHVVITNAPIEIGPGIKGTYDLDKTIWVDPVTGSIINQEQHDVRTLKDGTNAIDLQIAFDNATRDRKIQEAKDNIKSLDLLTKTLPLIGFIVGPLLIIVGFVVLFLGRRRRETPELA